METKIKKMREKLIKHRNKITELQAETAVIEQEIKKAEEEQLGYLARSAANMLSGGMDDVFELLRALRAKSDADAAAVETVDAEIIANTVNPVSSVSPASTVTPTDFNEDKEDESVENDDETEV